MPDDCRLQGALVKALRAGQASARRKTSIRTTSYGPTDTGFWVVGSYDYDDLGPRTRTRTRQPRPRSSSVNGLGKKRIMDKDKERGPEYGVPETGNPAPARGTTAE
jgi:hypothetical protein